MSSLVIATVKQLFICYNWRIHVNILRNDTYGDRYTLFGENSKIHSLAIKTFFMTASFCRNGNHNLPGRGATIFFFSTTGIPPVIFFSSRRSSLVFWCRQGQDGRGGTGEGWLSPRERDQRKNYQGSKRSPGFGPVGDLPHVNKDRASVAWCCPA